MRYRKFRGFTDESFVRAHEKTLAEVTMVTSPDPPTYNDYHCPVNCLPSVQLLQVRGGRRCPFGSDLPATAISAAVITCHGYPCSTVITCQAYPSAAVITCHGYPCAAVITCKGYPCAAVITCHGRLTAASCCRDVMMRSESINESVVSVQSGTL